MVFHAQLRNKFGWGETTHFKLQIDTKPPLPFEITVKEGVETTHPQPTLLFETIDEGSGVDYYENKAIPQADLILDNAQKSFENGAINYVEYVHSIDAVLVIRYSYLEMLNDYNQSVIAVEYLIGR